MLSHIFRPNYRYLCAALAALCLTLPVSGCSSSDRDSSSQENANPEYIEYNGVKKSRKDLSEDTIQWLEWYQSLPQDEQNALAIVPAEFASDNTASTADMKQSGTSGIRYHYTEALSDNELFETEELVRLNYSEANDAEIFETVPDDFPWYSNKGIEDEYTPGNIIIYRILTTENRLNGNGYLIVSIGRHSKSDPWKIINSGF